MPFLKNTDFIEGIVVYAGHETKAMLNNGGLRYKRSRLEKQMNVDVIWCVIIVVIACAVGTTGCRLWLSVYTSSTGYIAGSIPFLYDIQDPGYDSMLAVWMTKIGLVYHIDYDPALNDQETGRKAACRALNITEELGQIQYVFFDKTGTLTENKMLYRRCVVGDQAYEHLGEGEKMVSCSRLKEDLLIGPYKHRLQEFLISLATCNTVVVNAHPHRDIVSASGVVDKITKMERFIKKHSPFEIYNNRV